jgi:hypothetical protein
MRPPPVAVPCARHPNVETVLRCSKCETPICPRCLVQTPVGARCPQCAQLRRPPPYDVTWPLYLRAALAGLVVSVVSGMVWANLPLALPFFQDILVAMGVGYAHGAAVSWAARLKRGIGLQVIAGTGMTFAWALMVVMRDGVTFLGFFALILGIALAIERLR